MEEGSSVVVRAWGSSEEEAEMPADNSGNICLLAQHSGNHTHTGPLSADLCMLLGIRANKRLDTNDFAALLSSWKSIKHK